MATEMATGMATGAAAIEKAFLMDSDGKPIAPDGRQAADLKAAQDDLAAGLQATDSDDDHWWIGSLRDDTIKRAINERWGHLSGSLAEFAHLVEVTKREVNRQYDEWICRADGALVEETARQYPNLRLDKTSDQHRARAREALDLNEVHFAGILAVAMDDADEAFKEARRPSGGWPRPTATTVRTVLSRGNPARADGPALLKAIEKIASRPAPSPDLSKLAEKLDDIADRPQEISVTVNLDEARLAQAIATAIKPRVDVEVLAKDAQGRVALMRRADGTVVRFEYDQDGVIEAIRIVDDVEAALTWLGSAEKSPDLERYREMARSPELGEVSESAQRVLRSKGASW